MDEEGFTLLVALRWEDEVPHHLQFGLEMIHKVKNWWAYLLCSPLEEGRTLFIGIVLCQTAMSRRNVRAEMGLKARRKAKKMVGVPFTPTSGGLAPCVTL